MFLEHQKASLSDTTLSIKVNNMCSKDHLTLFSTVVTKLKQLTFHLCSARSLHFLEPWGSTVCALALAVVVMTQPRLKIICHADLTSSSKTGRRAKDYWTCTWQASHHLKSNFLWIFSGYNGEYTIAWITKWLYNPVFKAFVMQAFTPTGIKDLRVHNDLRCTPTLCLKSYVDLFLVKDASLGSLFRNRCELQSE